MFQYLLATNSIDFIAGDFNYDLLKASHKKMFRYIYRPCPHGKYTNTCIWMFDRSCLYQEGFDGKKFNRCNCLEPLFFRT